jgi:hypothetical protein
MIDTYNIIGLIGMSSTVLAYFLMSFGFISSGAVFQLMNAFGSALLVYSLVFHHNISSMILEIVWFAISVASLVKIVIKKAKA